MDDNKIIFLLQQRSERGLKHLAEKYDKLLYSVIRQILSDQEDQKECLNDTYLGIWNSIPPNNPEFLSAYICKVAKNTALKAYRKNTAKKRNREFQCSLEEIGMVLSESGIEHLLEAKEIGNYINDFLQTLNSQDRTLFVNRYWFSYSNKELAKMYRMKENSVSVRLLRIREKLKNYLSERGY